MAIQRPATNPPGTIQNPVSDDLQGIFPFPPANNAIGTNNTNIPLEREIVEYDQDYFSGSTVRVFFQDIWVDDIITIQFNASQQKTPIYGYASQFFDAVANGTFLIQGSFSIAFKETGFLYTVLSKLKNVAGDTQIAQLVADAKRDNSRLSSVLENSPAYGRVGNTTKIENFTIEDWIGSSAQGESQFENVAEALEDVLWGVKEYDILDPNNPPGVVRQQNRIPRADEMDRVENPFKVGRIGPGYDILITYGDINDGPSNHTVKTLSGIHITGHSQTIAPTGDGIVEVYSFFGRSVNDRIQR